MPFCAQALGGAHAIVLLAGEAGIGKTALARELAARARARGADVVWGAGWDGGGAPAMWPWAQVVRELARRRTPEELRADAGTGAPWLAAVSPELRAALGDVPAAPPADDELRALPPVRGARRLPRGERRPRAARRRARRPALDGRAVPARARARRPHAARRAAARRWARTATTRRAARTDLSAVLGGLQRTARSISLRGLSEAAVGELVAHHAGADAQPDLARTVHDVSAGNPFFADELARLLLAEGAHDTRAAAAAPRRRRRDDPPPHRAAAAGDRADPDRRRRHRRRVPPRDARGAAGVELAARARGRRRGHPRGARSPASPGRAALPLRACARARDAPRRPPARRAQRAARRRRPRAARALRRRAPTSTSPSSRSTCWRRCRTSRREEALRYALDAGRHAVARFDHAEGARLFDRAADLRDVLGPDDARDADVFQALGRGPHARG